MSKETERLKADARARREEVLHTLDEVSTRIDETRVFFILGLVSGVLLLMIVNRIFFRPFRRAFRRRRCCSRA